MRQSLAHPVVGPFPAHAEHVFHDLRARVCAEYREMPGLKLTLAQAARLFGIDAARCARVLTALVESGHLVHTPRGFARAEVSRRCA